MIIENSTLADVDEIFMLYAHATGLQIKRGCVPWPVFDLGLIKKEITGNCQWKMIVAGRIACIWATTFSDPFIWEDRNKDPAVYIHRIATAPDFAGNKLVAVIVSWAAKYALQNDKKFIRLDTVGRNEKLIEHYKNCGFNYLGLSALKNTNDLPAHYHNAAVSLFEIRLTN